MVVGNKLRLSRLRHIERAPRVVVTGLDAAVRACTRMAFPRALSINHMVDMTCGRAERGEEDAGGLFHAPTFSTFNRPGYRPLCCSRFAGRIWPAPFVL